jgi:hypothetical protein
MKVVNKHPRYHKNSDRIKSINQAYTIVFRAINKIEPDTVLTAKRNSR